MVSNYPDFDPAPEAAWREKRAALYALTTETTAEITALEARLADLQTRISSHLDAVARGEPVPADAHRPIEDEVRAVDSDLLYIRALLKRRNAMLAEHDKTAMSEAARVTGALNHERFCAR